MLLVGVRQRSLISRKYFPIKVLGKMNWENMGKRSSYSTENMECTSVEEFWAVYGDNHTKLVLSWSGNKQDYI